MVMIRSYNLLRLYTFIEPLNNYSIKYKSVSWRYKKKFKIYLTPISVIRYFLVFSAYFRILRGNDK